MEDAMWGIGINEAGTWWEVRENINKVTEAAVRRVQEDSKQAQQIWQQIKKDKAVNAALAQFLSFLLKDIKEDKIIKGLYDTFFKVKDPKTNITYFRKVVNIVVIVGLFAPFYGKKIHEDKLDPFFSHIYDFNSTISLSSYVSFLKALSAKYHDNVPLDKAVFLNFLIQVVFHYNLVKLPNITPESHEELKQSLSKELYWHSP